MHLRHIFSTTASVLDARRTGSTSGGHRGKCVRLRVHEAIAQALIDHGVDTLFGLMGDANMFIIDSFVRRCGGRYVSGASEAAVVAMAGGYAAASGKLGVATVTLGPGVTNSITALIEGVKGALPLVLLAGDTPGTDRDSIPNVHQQTLIAAAGAGFEQLRSARSACVDVAIAVRRALTERRPIALNMPIDLQWAETDHAPTVFRLPEHRSFAGDGADFGDATGIVATAMRPIVLAGRGAIDSASRAALLRLAARTDAMLATTLKGKGLFHGEDGNLGIFGSLSAPRTVDAVLSSDCIVAFGASLNEHTTSEGTFLRGKRVIQVNREASEIGRYAQPDVGIVGDPALVADAMLDGLEKAEAAPSGFRGEFAARAGSLKDDPGRRTPERRTPERRNGTVDIRSALRSINEAVPAERTYVTDAGRFIGQAWVLVDVAHPSHFIPAANYGAIGLGMSAAVGAATAVDDRVTLMVTGDGGLMLGGLAEFNTAVRHRCDLIVVVCNDGSYGAEHMKFRARNMDPALSLFEWPDFAPIAVALGGHGVTVRSDGDLECVKRAIRDREGPLLIDLKLDPDAVPALP